MPTDPTRALAPASAGAVQRQDLTAEDLDEQLVRSWLRSHLSEHTRDAYARDVARFRAFVHKPLAAVGIDDLQDFAESLTGQPTTRARQLAAVKSLLGYGHRNGMLRLNVGAQLKLPRRENRLAERILPRDDVRDLLRLEPDPRNHALLRLAYYAGVRVSELVSLQWRHLQPRMDGGQVGIFGKGGKTRVILLPRSVWREVNALRQSAPADAYVFQGQRAAARAGIDKHVSIHTLSHSHASHVLRHGKAPIDLHAQPDDSSARYLDGDN